MKTTFCFYSQLNYSHPRTAIEAEILFAARIMQVRFLELVSGKTPREQSSSGKKIEAESAVLHFVFFEVIVNKMQQSAKRIRSNKNILMEILSFILILMIMILHGMKRVILFIVIQLIILMMRLHLNRC